MPLSSPVRRSFPATQQNEMCRGEAQEKAEYDVDTLRVLRELPEAYDQAEVILGYTKRDAVLDESPVKTSSSNVGVLASLKLAASTPAESEEFADDTTTEVQAGEAAASFEGIHVASTQKDNGETVKSTVADWSAERHPSIGVSHKQKMKRSKRSKRADSDEDGQEFELHYSHCPSEPVDISELALFKGLLLLNACAVAEERAKKDAVGKPAARGRKRACPGCCVLAEESV